MLLLYHAYVYLEFLILACTIYILAPTGILHQEEGVDYIPSDIELAGMDVRLTNVVGREAVLRNVLEPLQKRYDYCLIDCMPSLGMLTIGVLAASDSVLIPVQAQHFPLKGLIAL